MSRRISISRTYPSYHPKAGQNTYFIEKIVGGLVAANAPGYGTELIKSLRDSGLLSISVLNELNEGTYAWYKHHTIRAGHRWKAGDWFQPFTWGTDINPKSGRSGPYQSKQITFAPEIQIKKVWDLDIHGTDWYLDGRHEYTTGWNVSIKTVSENDGLVEDDFYDWFTMSPDFKKKQEFCGQILCWNESINYSYE